MRDFLANHHTFMRDFLTNHHTFMRDFLANHHIFMRDFPQKQMYSIMWHMKSRMEKAVLLLPFYFQRYFSTNLAPIASFKKKR